MSEPKEQTSSFELPKAYEAKHVDPKWYEVWEKGGFFKPNDNTDLPPFSIVMPPPNVTGALHMGHALVSTLQDILIRWKRMQGHPTLWVPGTDHAGIATQTVVERNLMRDTGKRRTDFSREEFLEKVWHWKEEYEQRILSQLKKMGSSCDWSRLRFTMDEGNNLAVRTMFKKLYDQGLIYQGDYLVNWDPVTQTALADDEVEYEEKDSFLWFIRYPLEDGSASITIATTRPETMLGDTAVAVSPKDHRYQSLIGKNIRHPFTNRLIPIIGDAFVDPAFGTGAVKITPAHDPNDYQMALRQNLPMINVMTVDGKINENGYRFQGLTVEEARVKVLEALTQEGYFVKKQPHLLRVGVSYRSKAIIQPLLSKQWFVKMEPFKEKLRSIVETKKTELIPNNWESVYFHWIDNLRDWCISRQLWWGHRIPVWHNKTDPNKKICFEGVGVPPEVASHPDDWTQDPDVLDTWFSAGLWPFSTMGWPEKTSDLERFYPNSVLVTGHDILFFWVARMIMMGEAAMGEPPFPKVFLHGLIYGKSYWRKNPDGGITYVTNEERVAYDLGTAIPHDVSFKWEKMSKSKGNIIDPLEMIEAYGTDATRMALASTPVSSRQIDLDRRRFEEFKNFTNKVWNGARFVLMHLTQDPLQKQDWEEKMPPLKLEDEWILSRLNQTIDGVSKSLENYQFDQASMKAYEFFWNEFCAYYVEFAKSSLMRPITPADRKTKQKILFLVLDHALRLLHPFAPFITEELFHILKGTLPKESLEPTDPYLKASYQAENSPSCIVAPYPQSLGAINTKVEEDFKKIGDVIYAIRNLRAEMKLPPQHAIEVCFVLNDQPALESLLKENQGMIKSLIKTHSIEVHKNEPVFPFSSFAQVGSLKIVIPLPEDLIQEEKNRMQKELKKLEETIEKLKAQLNNQDFIARAPQALVEKNKVNLAQAENQVAQMKQKLGV